MRARNLIGTVLLAAVASGPALAQEWGGFYLGGHLAGTKANGDYTAFTPNNGFAGFDLQNLDGTALGGGLHGGYNWDQGAYVMGLEASLTGFGLSEGSTDSNEVGSVPVFTRDVDNQLFLAGRIGWEAGNSLIFARAGLAAAKIGASHDQNSELISGSSTETGWMVGIGAEFPLAERLTGRIDLTHADYGTVRTDMSGLPDIWVDDDLTTTQISVGISYYFN